MTCSKVSQATSASCIKAELNGDVDSENNQGGSSTDIYRIGPDIKRTINCCINDVAGMVSSKARFQQLAFDQITG